MAGPDVERRVGYDEVDETWNKFFVSGIDPAVVLNWIEENLSGPWAVRFPDEEEVEARTGRKPDGRIFLVLAFAWQDDADRFQLWHGDPAGHA
jgi:hypothetical protein